MTLRQAETPLRGRLNVVVVLTDHQEPASLRELKTVRRELIARGTGIQNAFASPPQCCPSRATLLTGQHAHNHGIRGNGPELGGYAHRVRSQDQGQLGGPGP
jgi:N-acetylglucosamine-6-sulfatase